MVPLSLFADPERILRRLYVFAEEPCKSTTTTSEPCSPVFKEVQPRPSEHSNLEYHINNLNLYLYVFGLFIIFVIKAIQPDCDKIKGISVLLLETPLTRSKYFSPYTHAQRLTRTSGTFCTFAYKQTLHSAWKKVLMQPTGNICCCIDKSQTIKRFRISLYLIPLTTQREHAGYSYTLSSVDKMTGMKRFRH